MGKQAKKLVLAIRVTQSELDAFDQAYVYGASEIIKIHKTMVVSFCAIEIRQLAYFNHVFCLN